MNQEEISKKYQNPLKGNPKPPHRSSLPSKAPPLGRTLLLAVLLLSTQPTKARISDHLLNSFLKSSPTHLFQQSTDSTREYVRWRANPPQCPTSLFAHLIPTNKYTLESHDVITEDGYILMMFRVRSINAISNNQIAYLQHGFDDDSHCFFMNGNMSLGFMLADAGFDVWVGNNRGSKYSRRHVSLKITSRAFWEFSFQQMARYDLPAFFNHIKSVSWLFSHFWEMVGFWSFWIGVVVSFWGFWCFFSFGLN